jgi:preflagellin peptidase FlaK
VELQPLDLARLAVGAFVLSVGSFTDWYWRRAPNLLWIVAGAAGALLLAVQLATTPGLLQERWPMLVVDAVFAGLMLLFYRLGLLAGGADAKALISLALLVPLPVDLGALPLRTLRLPPAFAILGNAVLAFLAVPLGLLVVNLARRDLRFPHLLLATRMPIADARGKHVWPMEYVKDGQVRTMYMPSRFVWEDEDWDALLAAGRDRIWATPKVPFLIPLLVGFVLTFLAGDVLTGWLLGLD